jgi:zinc D-Ala-D-Ala carboxypeptidase
MNGTAPVRPTTRRVVVGGALGLIAAAIAISGALFLQTASSAAPPSAAAPSGEILGAEYPDATIEADGVVTAADGVLPEGVTVWDDGYPAIANLNPDLLNALRAAVTDAGDDGIELFVNSGWRSAEYQEQLLREAVFEYGSEEEAARWVASANASAHVSGLAVDVGSADAIAWLAQYGAGYGLCQIYGNEPWHYEVRPDAIDRGCPPSYADPTQDPRNE